MIMGAELQNTYLCYRGPNILCMGTLGECNTFRNTMAEDTNDIQVGTIEEYGSDRADSGFQSGLDAHLL